jgi:hypothetical protein
MLRGTDLDALAKEPFTPLTGRLPI